MSESRRRGTSPRRQREEADVVSSRPRRSDRHRRPARARQDPFFILLIVLAVAKAGLSRWLGLETVNPLATIALETAGILVLLGLIDIILPRRSYTLDLVAYTLLSAVMLANVMYVSFYEQIFSPSLLSAVGQAGAVTDAIESLLRPVYLLYVLDIPFLIAGAVWLRRMPSRPPRVRSRAVAIATLIALVVLCVQVVLVWRLGADVDSSAIARARGFGAYQIASLAELAVPASGSAAVAIESTPKGLTPAQAAERQIENIRKASDGPRIGDVKTGQYRGKNVIMIQVEALQDMIIGKSYDGQVITPNLNALVDKSWYFPNTYSETSAGNTVDAEFAVNTSLLPPVAGAASLQYADRELPGLPRLMRAQGYDAITLHQNDVRFWNRKELYPALGFRRYWDRSYFKMRDKMWHASDQILFSYGMKVLNSEVASGSPFYSFFITESSHTPFTAAKPDRWPIHLSDAETKSFQGRYIGVESYTDMAIGEFIAGLKKNGLWDNSIIIFYGDHCAVLDSPSVPASDPKVADKILGRPYSNIDHQRIPLIIHLPGQKVAHVETKPVGQVDIMPTIADLIGLDLSSVPHVGRSVFVDSNALIATRAYLPTGSFINDSVLFMPQLSFDDGSAVRVSDASAATPTDTERQDLARVKELNQLSDAWIRSLPVRPDAGSGKDAIIPH